MYDCQHTILDPMPRVRRIQALSHVAIKPTQVTRVDKHVDIVMRSIAHRFGRLV
jgi:hypothetical protein